MSFQRDLAAQELEEYFKFYPNFPKNGVNFWDIFAIFGNRKALQIFHKHIKLYADSLGSSPSVVVGIEARGFLIGPMISNHLGIPFVPVRKKGKLPGEVVSQSYTLEYGEDIIEIQKDAIIPGQNVVIVDDLLATGGTMEAAVTLVEKVGGHVLNCFVVAKVAALKAEDKITAPIEFICDI